MVRKQQKGEVSNFVHHLIDISNGYCQSLGQHNSMFSLPLHILIKCCVGIGNNIETMDILQKNINKLKYIGRQVLIYLSTYYIANTN